MTREREPVLAADEGVVERTLPFPQPSPRVMVRLQLLTGMRPGEVCRLKLSDLERDGDVWFYRPGKHKTKHAGKSRAVAIGPRAQAVIREYTRDRDTPSDAPPFSPARDRVERFAAMRSTRKGRVQPSQADRKSAGPQRAPRSARSCRADTKAVARACKRSGCPHWHVNQLRHAHATAVRALLGLEAAQASLGHARADTTQIYAERDLAPAARVAREMG